MAPPPIPVAHPPIEAHGYSKIGPGPMAAIRFKWTVRLDNGDYYVDETIGENSNPLVNGPLIGTPRSRWSTIAKAKLAGASSN